MNAPLAQQHAPGGTLRAPVRPTFATGAVAVGHEMGLPSRGDELVAEPGYGVGTGAPGSRRHRVRAEEGLPPARLPSATACPHAQQEGLAITAHGEVSHQWPCRGILAADEIEFSRLSGRRVV